MVVLIHSCKSEKDRYVCTPCDLSCDALTFSEPGTCPHCGMDLILESDVVPEEEKVLNEIDIKIGSGYFLIDGGQGNQDKTIKVFYHKPESFSANSKILLVIPGAGRNADTYRDAWIEESEEYDLLILSPMYPEKEYGFEAYHLGGLIKESNLADCIDREEGTNIVNLDEEKLQLTPNPDSETWLFNDLDRIFDQVVDALDSEQRSYDVFGHSAGGHILHRLALFQKQSKVNIILASNASFYTLPDFAVSYPFGVKDTPVDEDALKNTFKKNLVVFLGELDNAYETGGSFLRSNTADLQGSHRLERGKYFFNQAKEMAERLDVEFNWKLEIVPNVGHDHRLMGDAAGLYLYAGND